MAYCIQILERAVRSLQKIPEPYKSQIKGSIDRLEQFSQTMKNIRAMQGEYKGLYRLRVGDYRVLFDVVDANIIILDIFTRQTGY